MLGWILMAVCGGHMEVSRGNAGDGNFEGGEGSLHGGDFSRPSGGGGFHSGEGQEATEFLTSRVAR
jgi:hypothetical protein